MTISVPSGQKINIEGVGGDTYIDYSSGMRLVSNNVEILKNIGKLVSFSNTSQVIGAASSYKLQVSLTDTGYNAGAVFLSRATAAAGTLNFGMYLFGATAGSSAGLSCGSSASYLAFYNQVAGSVNYISHQMFSSVSSDVSLSSVGVNGSNLELIFWNHAGSFRTLNAMGYALVVKTR